MIDNHQPIPVSKFGGLYSRGSYNDTVPFDHFIDSLNTITQGQEILTRYGFTENITLANIKRTRLYKREGEATRIIILDSNGDFFDSAVSLVTPFLQVAGALDFSLEQYYNRAYITPSDGESGLSGEFVYVYQGSGNARKAAGVKPASGFTVALSATAGIVESGTHIFAWCYETDSGFITAPGPTVFQTIETDGTKALDFSNVPVGPAGTSKRKLVASRSIQQYNGDQNGYDMFFVSGGVIEDNITTVLNEVDFYDADLQLSADYAFDQLEEIPAGLFLSRYSGSLCIGNTNSDKSLLYVSKKDEPESVNSLSGFIVCDPFETEGIKGALEFRKNLYIFKGSPGHTYASIDNGYDPSTWTVDRIDSGIGADYNCASQFINESGSNSDFFLVADKAGLYPFNGSYLDTRYTLSFKIDKIWQRINKQYMHKVQLILDPKNYLIYVLVPLDAATSPSHILVGDYSEGLDWKRIRWHIWTSDEFTPTSILVDISNTTAKTYLRVSGASNVYDYDTAVRLDAGTTYASYIQFALLYQVPNYIHHFAALGMRIIGSGDLNINATSEDGQHSVNYTARTLATTPGREYLEALMYEDTKCSIKLSMDGASEYFSLYELNLYTNPLWATRPG